MSAIAALPVTVVTGFLGAGKTTLVQRWLAEGARGDVAVIVNEVGDVGIDGALLAGCAPAIVEITGGCICCATHAELVRALAALARAPRPPARILVETSGAASPAGVLRAIAGGGPDGAHALAGVVTVVDATRLAVLAAHPLAIEQVGYADVVVLSRADRLTAAARDAAVAAIAAHTGVARVVTAAHGALAEGTLAELLADTAELPAPRPAPLAAQPHAYASVALGHDGELDEDRFADFMETTLADVGGRLFRTKGILAIAGVPARVIVQGVADLVEVTVGAPWAEAPRTSRLVVVGYGLDRAALTAAFAACRA